MATKNKSGKWEFTDQELDVQIKKVKLTKSKDPIATNVFYNNYTRKVVVILDDGVELNVPVHLIQGLGKASSEQLSTVKIIGKGIAIRWDALNVDLGTNSLLHRIYGNPNWMKELASKGGRVKSSAKSAAARENGKKGGRPQKNLLIQNV
jgi:Protein of unknown function (DUF2442)